MQQYILQAAVYIANLFFLTSDTSAPIVKDTELNEEDIGMTVLYTSVLGFWLDHGNQRFSPLGGNILSEL